MQKKNLLFYELLFSTIACLPTQESGDEIIEAPSDICGQFSEPGKYRVKPCDLFLGPLGVNFQVKNVDEYDQIRGSYIDEIGNVLLAEEVFAAEGWEIAHFSLKLYADKGGIMNRSDNPKDLFDRCISFLYYSPEADPANHCSLVSPTEALPGETVFKSKRGYYGKTNDQTYSQLAECAAKDVDSVVDHTSAFLGLPPLNQGISLMHIFKDKTPLQTGLNVFSVSAWFYKKDDLKGISYAITECEQKINSGNFAEGDHELTHAFVDGFAIPHTFNEGLANYIPRIFNGKPEGWSTKGEQWNTTESMCKEEGFEKGYATLPYIKYYHDPMNFDSYMSGECFWQKLVHDYEERVIPTVMGVLKENVNQNKTFEENLLEAGIDTAKYQPWGLGE